MTQNVPIMISYDELYKLLYEKFEATHDEIRYWIKLSFSFNSSMMINNTLTPYHTDIASHNYTDLHLYYGQTYIYAKENFLNPQYHFYSKEEADKFIPLPINRFVYRKDLTGKRNWQEKDDRILAILKRANEVGILRCYDKESDTFTLYAPKSKMLSNSIDDSKGFLWCNSFHGDDYFNKPDSFFLLYDILILERVFLGKSREACEQEIRVDCE